MDPVSQGAFGAIFAQTISNKKKLLAGSILGCIAGLAPDIDIFIRSGTDPLLKLEFHRQFTHSLVFIPIGALLVTLLSRLFFKNILVGLKVILFVLLVTLLMVYWMLVLVMERSFSGHFLMKEFLGIIFR